MNTEEMPMATISVSLPESIKEFVETQVAAGAYRTVDEYLEKLILADRQRKAEEKLARQLEQGLAGPWIEASDEYWEARRVQLLADYQNKQSRK